MFQSQELELIGDDPIRTKAGRLRPSLEQSSKLILSYGLKFRHIVVGALSYQLDRHFPQSANAIRVSAVIGCGNLAPADSVIHNFLLIS